MRALSALLKKDKRGWNAKERHQNYSKPRKVLRVVQNGSVAQQEKCG